MNYSILHYYMLYIDPLNFFFGTLFYIQLKVLFSRSRRLVTSIYLLTGVCIQYIGTTTIFKVIFKCFLFFKDSFSPRSFISFPHFTFQNILGYTAILYKSSVFESLLFDLDKNFSEMTFEYLFEKKQLLLNHRKKNSKLYNQNLEGCLLRRLLCICFYFFSLLFISKNWFFLLGIFGLYSSNEKTIKYWILYTILAFSSKQQQPEIGKKNRL